MSAEYIRRTEQNVIDSDGTVVFSIQPELSGGTKRTADFARKHRKPLLHIHSATADPGTVLRALIEEHGIQVLNVAGPRASTEPQIGESVRKVL